MQVEPLLVSNNATCLTSSLCLEPGSAPGLEDALERVGTGAAELSMDLFGAATSIPPVVLQPSPPFNANLDQLDGPAVPGGESRAAETGSDNTQAKPCPLAAGSTSGLMTDWPPTWQQQQQQCGMAITTTAPQMQVELEAEPSASAQASGQNIRPAADYATAPSTFLALQTMDLASCCLQANGPTGYPSHESEHTGAQAVTSLAGAPDGTLPETQQSPPCQLETPGIDYCPAHRLEEAGTRVVQDSPMTEMALHGSDYRCGGDASDRLDSLCASACSTQQPRGPGEGLESSLLVLQSAQACCGRDADATGDGSSSVTCGGSSGTGSNHAQSGSQSGGAGGPGLEATLNSKPETAREVDAAMETTPVAAVTVAEAAAPGGAGAMDTSDGPPSGPAHATLMDVDQGMGGKEAGACAVPPRPDPQQHPVTDPGHMTGALLLGTTATMVSPSDAAATSSQDATGLAAPVAISEGGSAAQATAPPTAAPNSVGGLPGTGVPSAAAGVAADALAVELGQIVARCGGVSDTRFAGRLSALVESEERLGGRITLLSVVQQSSQEVLRLFVQGSGLRSLEQWVMQFRDEGRHGALVKVICCLKMLPIDLTALKGSSIGQTVGKLRKHANPQVRTAAAELVDQWKGVVDRSVGKGETRQGTKSKADSAAQEGPNKRAKKSDHVGSGTAKQGLTSGSDGHPPAASISKLAVMDDDLFVAGTGSGSGSGASHASGPHRPLGLTSFISGAKKVHAMKLENILPNRLGSSGGAPAAPATTANAAGSASAPGQSSTGREGATSEDGTQAAGATSPTGSGQDGAAAGPEAGTDVGAVASPGPESPKPNGGDAAAALAAGQTPSLLPHAADGTASPATPSTGAVGVGAPRPVALPRLGTLAGPSTPTVRLGSLRDGSLPTSGIARLGAATGVGGGVGGRTGTAASLPAAVAPGGPQSAHARAMAARARAPSPEPAPRKEKRKTVSWAVDDMLESYRLFKKDDPPQLAASDAVLTAEDEAALPDPNGIAPPPGFQSAARREHASERMALIAQHQQEEQERQQELERWTAMRPTVPWVEPPELYLGAVSPQQLPGLGEESTEREVQARFRQHTPRVVYYSPSQVPHSPGEPPPEPEPDFYRVRQIPLNVPGVGMPSVGVPGPGPGPGALPPQAVALLPPGALFTGGQPSAAPPPPHPGLPPPPQGLPQYTGQLQSGPPPQLTGILQPPPPQQQQQQQPPGQSAAGPPPGAGLTLPPDLVASLPALISSLSQQPQPQQQLPGALACPGPQASGAGPGAGGGPDQQPGVPPPPHALPHPHPHSLPPHPHARVVGGPHGGPPPPSQIGQPPPLITAPGGPMLGPPGAPMRPMEYGMPPQPHPGLGPGQVQGPAGMPTGPGRPGSRFEPAPGPGAFLGQGGPPGPGSAGGPPPPPPRKDGQPTLMRPRRGDDPAGPPGPGPGPGTGVPPGPPHGHPHAHPSQHGMGPSHGGMRHPPPHGHPHGHGIQGGGPPHGMGPPGPANGPGPGMGGWAPGSGSGGVQAGPPSGAPPVHGPGPSGKVCAYFNTPGGCRNGESCRFVHIPPQDGGSQYDNGPYPGRGGLGMGRGGSGPPGMQGGVRRR